MIDYSYVECSSSAMQALAFFSEQFPDHRAAEIRRSIKRGARFIEAMQLGSPEVPYGVFCFFLGGGGEGFGGVLGSLNKIANAKKGALIVTWLLGYQGSVMMAAGLDAGATASRMAAGLALKGSSLRGGKHPATLSGSV